MTGPRESREAQEGATGEGRGGKGHSQAPSLAFLLAFSLTLVAFMPVIWPSPLQRLLGHPLAQYVIWLRCRGLSVGLDVFGSLVPMTAAALLAIAFAFTSFPCRPVLVLPGPLRTCQALPPGGLGPQA